MDKKKKKKVNQLNIKECEEILKRLAGQTENKYYLHVLEQYKRLIPSKDITLPLI